MQEKIRLIIIMGLAVMLAVSIFVGLQTYTSRRAVELDRNNLRNENEMLAKRVEEAIQERNRIQEKVKALTNDLDKAAKEKQDIQQQYALMTKDKDDLSEKIKTLQKNNEQLRGDLSNLQRERQRLGQRLEDNLSPLKNENEQLKQQLDNLNTMKRNLEAEVGKLKQEKSESERKLADIDSVLEQNLTRLKYATIKEQLDNISAGGAAQTQVSEFTQPAQSEKESVQLPPIVVKPQAKSKPELPPFQRKAMPAKQTGTVLNVNKENKFVIVDLGQDAGTKLGDTFKVYKQGAPIATVQVIQVRQSISACDIKEEITPIEAGDIVR